MVSLRQSTHTLFKHFSSEAYQPFVLVLFLGLVSIVRVTAIFISAVTFLSSLTLLLFFVNHRLGQALVLPTPPRTGRHAEEARADRLD